MLQAVIFLLIIFAIPSSAFAASCKDVLKWGIWENYESTAANESDQKIINWACNSSQSANEGSFGFEYEGVSGDAQNKGSGSSKSCNFDSKDFHVDDKYKDYLKKASPEITKSWLSCMQADGFGGRASLVYSNDPELFGIMLRFQGPSTNHGVAKVAFVIPGKDADVTCSENVEDIGKGISFDYSLLIGCSRSNLQRPINIVVNFDGGWGSTTLRVPKVNIEAAAPAKPNPDGSWCKEGSDTKMRIASAADDIHRVIFKLAGSMTWVDAKADYQFLGLALKRVELIQADDSSFVVKESYKSSGLPTTSETAVGRETRFLFAGPDKLVSTKATIFHQGDTTSTVSRVLTFNRCGDAGPLTKAMSELSWPPMLLNGLP